MKVTETITRECCQHTDLKPVEGTPRVGHQPLWMFCVHCGRYHRLESERDAAGGTDTVYRGTSRPFDPSGTDVGYRG